MAKAIDWPGLMRLGLGRLRLTPEAFWAMTPLELVRAAEGAGFLAPGAAMDRRSLMALMAAFPDRTPDGADKQERRNA